MIEEAVGTLVVLAALAFAVGVAWAALDWFEPRQAKPGRRKVTRVFLCPE